MWNVSLGLAGFLIVAITAMPVPRLRRVALSFMAWALNLGVLVFVGWCAVLYCGVEQPPEKVSDLVKPLTAWLTAVWPAEGWSKLVWLPISASVVVLALPFLMVLDFACRLARRARSNLSASTGASKIDQPLEDSLEDLVGTEKSNSEGASGGDRKRVLLRQLIDGK